MKEKHRREVRDPRWKKRSFEIKQRDGWKCRECGCAYRQLHVHHRWYIRGKTLWEHPDRCLVTLCNECHEIAHGLRKRKIRPFLFIRRLFEKKRKRRR